MYLPELLQTRITECSNYSYITGIQDGSKIGYKYFSCPRPVSVCLEVRGDFDGNICIAADEDSKHVFADRSVRIRSENWLNIIFSENISGNNVSLYLNFKGCGKLDLRTIGFTENILK